MDNFNIYSLETPTNNDLTIIFTPYQSVSEYTYRVYKNDELYSALPVLGNTPSEITLDTSGKYVITASMMIDGETYT